MTITTYYATHKLDRRNAEADAIIHLINDTTYGNGDNRSWDAMRAHIDALADPETQQRLKITIEDERIEPGAED